MLVVHSPCFRKHWAGFSGRFPPAQKFCNSSLPLSSTWLSALNSLHLTFTPTLVKDFFWSLNLQDFIYCPYSFSSESTSSSDFCKLGVCSYNLGGRVVTWSKGCICDGDPRRTMLHSLVTFQLVSGTKPRVGSVAREVYSLVSSGEGGQTSRC